MRTNTQTKKSKQNITTMIIIWAMIIVFTGGTYVHAYLLGNHSGGAYEDPRHPRQAVQVQVWKSLAQPHL